MVSLRNQGFTLTEVLVVLAIMVILFGMLFVPITTSIEMTRSAQNRSQMNQTMRLAMEQLRRELSDAVAFYLPDIIPRGDGTYIVNYSNITFVPPEREASGQVSLPVRPRTDHDGNTIAVRYAVHTPAATRGGDTVTITVDSTDIDYLVEQPTTVDNPFVLYRQEGYMVQHPVTGANLFGNEPPGEPGLIVGLPLSENALTPVREADVPVTETVMIDPADGYVQIAPGYVRPGVANFPAHEDPGSWSAQTRLVYVHGGIQFSPLRVEGETMQAGANNTIYTAGHGNWLGRYNYGDESVADIVWGSGDFIYSSELRPRIIVRRDTYGILLDTDELDPGVAADSPTVVSGTVIDNMFDLRWNSTAGTVSGWLPYPDPVEASVTFQDSDPGSGEDLDPPDPGQIWGISGSATVGSIAEVAGTQEYTVPGTRSSPLTGAPAGNQIFVQDARRFNVGESVSIVDAVTGSEPLGTVQTRDEVTYLWVTTENAPVGVYDGSDEVLQATDDSAKAYSTYEITLPEVSGTADKMIIPSSVRVWAVGRNQKADSSWEQASLEYNRVSFAIPSAPTATELSSIGPQQFAIEADGSGDYRVIKIHFGNSAPGPDGVRVPPPSPDEPATYGGPSNWQPGATVEDDSLDDFYIWVEYQYRRNFDTNGLATDVIEVSYSTQEVYNVALEVMPYRYLDEVEDGVWRPHGAATGVQMRAQVEVRNLSR